MFVDVMAVLEERWVTLDRSMLYVGGGWVSPSAGAAIVMEAATGAPLGRAAMASRADVDRAVAAARTALPMWRGLAAGERAQRLRGLADALEARCAETSALVSRENGMPITKSMPAEGIAPAYVLRYFCDLVEGRSEDEVRSGFAGPDVLVTRDPVGVLAAVIPWNYPHALASFKLGPALASGCTVVLKAAPETALDIYLLADAAEEAGLPAGVLNVIAADREAGAHLVSHPDVDKVAFTGSTEAGRDIAEVCGRLLRPVTLELGGKSAAILLEDADLDLFVAQLLDVCLPNNGQTCHASTRVLAPRSRYPEIVDTITAAVAALRVGDPLDPATEIGPVASAHHRERVLGLIRAGKGRLTTGGAAPDRPGWFVNPTVFADVSPRDRVFQEEVFGPVMTITPYDGDDSAVDLANDSAYGLAGTVWSADDERGLSIARRVQTGTFGVNGYGFDLAAPFGGVKASGLGRELGPEGLAAYEHLKSIYLPSPA